MGPDEKAFIASRVVHHALELPHSIHSDGPDMLVLGVKELRAIVMSALSEAEAVGSGAKDLSAFLAPPVRERKPIDWADLAPDPIPERPRAVAPPRRHLDLTPENVPEPPKRQAPPARKRFEP